MALLEQIMYVTREVMLSLTSLFQQMALLQPEEWKLITNMTSLIIALKRVILAMEMLPIVCMVITKLLVRTIQEIKLRKFAIIIRTRNSLLRQTKE